MKFLDLSNEHLADLICEKVIMIDGMTLRSSHSFLSILAKIHERMTYGKISTSQDAVFLRSAKPAMRRNRKQCTVGV